jgi:hypothetical protein
MEKTKRFRWLRILGIGSLIVGVFLPWFQLGFEPHPSSIQWSGLEDILDSGGLAVESMLEDGPDLYSTMLLLEGFSGVGLIFYFFYSISSVKKVRKGNKMLSLFLIGTSIVFLFNSQSPVIGRVLFGFWPFILGLLLSAIVEWLSSTDFAAK